MRFHDVWQGNAIAQESVAVSPGAIGQQRYQQMPRITCLLQSLMF